MRPRGLRVVVGAAVITAMLVVGCSNSGDSGRVGDGSGDGVIAAEVSGRLKPVLDTGGAWDSVRAILVTVDGKSVFEMYYDGTIDEYNNVFSITKSLMSTLIGIAVGEGRIASRRKSNRRPKKCRARRMSPGSVRNIYEVLARMLEAAADDRVIATSPCSRITLPKDHDDELRVPTLKDIERVQVALGQQWQPIPVVLAGTGIFASESCSACGFPTWTSCDARSTSSANGSSRAGSRR